MGQAHFPRREIRTAATDANIRYSVVRCPERSLADEGGVALQFSCHAVNLSCLQTFGE